MALGNNRKAGRRGLIGGILGALAAAWHYWSRYQDEKAHVQAVIDLASPAESRGPPPVSLQVSGLEWFLLGVAATCAVIAVLGYWRPIVRFLRRIGAWRGVDEERAVIGRLEAEVVVFGGKQTTLANVFYALRRSWEDGLTERDWLVRVRPVEPTEAELAEQMSKPGGKWEVDFRARENRPKRLLLDLANEKLIRQREGVPADRNGPTYGIRDEGRDVLLRIKTDPAFLHLTQG